MEGMVSADKTGALLDPLAVREDAGASLRAVCGEPGAVSDRIVRHPYRENAGAETRITWTTIGEPQTLAIWLPGEEPQVREASAKQTRYLTTATQLGVSLADLTPGAVYCYELRGSSGEREYGPMGLRATPAADTDERIDFVVFGDSGGGSPDQATVASQMGSVPLDFMLHVGDMAYSNGTLAEFETNHFAMYRELNGAFPLFPAIGAHDDATDSAGPYREVFTLPENERHYSFDWGPVHVVVVDALANSREQEAWVEQDLRATDQPWKVAVVTAPMYSSGYHGSAMSIRNAYEPIFQRHGVQLVFSGDDHDYERSRPMGGVTYIVTGGGGRSVYPVGSSDWTELSVSVLHFTYVTVEGDTMRIHAIDATGREFDGVEIRR
jgi:hypothetical protein